MAYLLVFVNLLMTPVSIFIMCYLVIRDIPKFYAASEFQWKAAKVLDTCYGTAIRCIMGAFLVFGAEILCCIGCTNGREMTPEDIVGCIRVWAKSNQQAEVAYSVVFNVGVISFFILAIIWEMWTSLRTDGFWGEAFALMTAVQVACLIIVLRSFYRGLDALRKGVGCE